MYVTNNKKEFQLKASMWKAFQIQKNNKNHSIRTNYDYNIYKIYATNHTHSPDTFRIEPAAINIAFCPRIL